MQPCNSSTRPRLWIIPETLILLALAAVLSVAAFYTVGAGFVLYDDVGHLMLTQKTFLAGHPLYDQTFTRYGPAYYAWEQLLHAVTRLPLSHDTTLLFTTASLVAVALLCAGCVARLTRNVFLAALGAFAVFCVLTVLKKEAGHPQELCALLLGGMLLAASFLTAGRCTAGLLALIGFLMGLLCMTKPNLGAFAALAGWLSMSNLLAHRTARRLLFGAAAVAALALPAALMGRNLAGAADYCLLEGGAVLLLVGQLAASRHERTLSLRAFAAPALGCAAAVVACTAYALATGTSVAGLVHGLFLQHMSADQAFFRWPDFGIEQVFLSLALAGGAWVVTGPGRGLWQKAVWVPTAVKTSVAPLVLLLTWLAPPSAYINPAFLWCLPLIAATGGLSARQPKSVWDAAPRQFAVALTVLNALWGYPIWGRSQAGLSFFLLVPVALVWCADGLRYGLWQSAKKTPPSPAAAAGAGTAGLRAVSCAAALSIVVLALIQARSAEKAYRQLAPSGLRGSQLLRMPPEQAAFYHWVVEAARAHGKSFFTMPGLGSLYFWADANPPTSLYPTTWMTLLTPDEQTRVVQDLQGAPDLCVVRWKRQVDFWCRGRDISGNKVVRYIEDNFVPADSFGGCEILVRGTRAGQNR